MLSFLSLAKQPSLARNITSLALGKFDGMHSAHQVLFEKLGDKGAILCIENNQGELLPQKYRAFLCFLSDFFTTFRICPQQKRQGVCRVFVGDSA